MTLAAGMAMGLVLSATVWAFWTWWMEVRADVSWRAFWLPVRDTQMHGKPWLKVHVVAHLIGGALLTLGLIGLGWQNPWFGAWWMRGLWLLVFQALWERIQHENWKEGGGSSAYPWWSAVWDVQITLVAWVLVEGVAWWISR